MSAVQAATSHGATQLRFDPSRGIVLRVLSGADEGREFVLPRHALAELPGAPPETVRGALARRALPPGRDDQRGLCRFLFFSSTLLLASPRSVA